MNRVFLLVCLFALMPIGVRAQMVITEIMYDLAEGSDSGREWIEVRNTGSAPIELTAWRVFENGTNHKISASGGGNTIAAGAYAVVADNPAKFKADWLNFSGTLFDSAFSLSNDGETIALRVGESDVDSVAFTKSDGGDGSGDSLQRTGGGVFDAGMPTPGVGIPLGGLQKSPPKVTKSAKKDLPAPVEQKIIGEPAARSGEVEHRTQAAAAATTAPKQSMLWWLAPLFLATIGSAGFAAAQHFKKEEWEIIEEVDETG
ncbi:MAG: lamin tail domain-containing protein [Minisyncoccia bacterium]